MKAEQTATQSRKELVARKSQIIDVLDKTIEIFQNDGNVDRVDVFQKLKDDFINEEYSIVVVGEFSTGKSTMLNALMRKKILTSFTRETTATVNFLRHKDVAKNGEEGRVFYTDGREEIIETADSKTIEKYVSTEGKDVVTNISKVDLYLDSDFLKDRVSIVDSPGLNGLAEGHRKITEDQILKSHACIFLFTADRAGGSKSEFEFLSNIQNKVNTVFFVLNKIDLINPLEGETVDMVVDILKENYKKVFADINITPEIWPISAGMALESRDPKGTNSKLSKEELEKLEKESLMSAFEDRLMQFLVRGEKTRSLFIEPLKRVQTVAIDARNEYKQEIELLENKQDSSDVVKQINELKEAMDEGKKKISEKKNKCAVFVKKANKNALNTLRSELEQLRTKKINEIKSYEIDDDIEGVINCFKNFEKDFSKKAKIVAEKTIEDLKSEIEYEIQQGTEEYLRDIDMELENLSIATNLESYGQLVMTEDLFTVGLEKMDEKTEAIEREIKDLEKEIAEKNKEVIESRKSLRKLKELRVEREKIASDREYIESRSIPSVEYSSKEEVVSTWRGGILGWVGNVLLGSKKTNRVVQVKDDSRYKAAVKRQEEDLAKANMREEELRQKMELVVSMSDPDMLELYESQRQDQEDRLAQKKEELNEEIRRKTRSIREKTRKNIRNIRRKLEDACEDMVQVAEQQIKSELKKIESLLVGVISANIEKRVNLSLEKEAERLEKLKEQLNASEQDKYQRLNMLHEKDDKLKNLLNLVINLCAEIENIPVDSILG